MNPHPDPVEEARRQHLIEGDVVVARCSVTDGGILHYPARADAAPCTPHWEHAKAGEVGICVFTEPGTSPTVRWFRTETATIVCREEVERLFGVKDVGVPAPSWMTVESIESR